MEMTEHMGYNPGSLNDEFVVFKWNGEWYKVPLMVLPDIIEEWAAKKNPKANQLRSWLKGSHYGPWEDKGVEQIKAILEQEMPQMIAYKMYDLA